MDQDHTRTSLGDDDRLLPRQHHAFANLFLDAGMRVGSRDPSAASPAAYRSVGPLLASTITRSGVYFAAGEQFNPTCHGV